MAGTQKARSANILRHLVEQIFRFIYFFLFCRKYVFLKSIFSAAMIQQFIQDVYWDQLDYLIIDTPPGKSINNVIWILFMNDPNGDLF